MTAKVLHVGVTGDALLTKKAYASMLESFEIRSTEVLKFLRLLNNDLDIRIFELNDPVGIAGTD
jgi:phosphopantetheine adenylyltransferase